MAAEAAAAPPVSHTSEYSAEAALQDPLLGAGEAEPVPVFSEERSSIPDLLPEAVDGEGHILGDLEQTGPEDDELHMRELAADGVAPDGEEDESEGEDDLELLALEPGQMRLQGTFEGVATTHTHQLDLAVGLNVEMPSEIAAEAIRQIASRSRSMSPKRALSGRASASPSPTRPLELPDERRTLWNTLSDFFRKDAREGARRASAPSGQRALPDLRLKLEDSSAHKQETQRLSLDLESSQGQAAQLEAQVITVTEERDSLRSKLELLMQEYSEQAMHMDGLRDQSERALSSGDNLNTELAEREAEVRELEAQLAEALQSLEVVRADVTKEQLARDRLESSLGAARRSHELMVEENRALKVEMAELSARTAGEVASLDAKVQALQSAAAAALPREQHDELAEQHDELAEQLRCVALERDELSARLAALESERGSLAARLQAAEAEASAAAAAVERAAELEAAVRSATAQSAKLQQEVPELRKQCNSLQAELERERAAKAEVGAPPVEDDRAGALGLLQLQFDEQLRQNEVLQSSLEGLQAELAQQSEARAAAQVQASEARGALATAQLSVEQLRREREELAARAAEAEASARAEAQQQPAEEQGAWREKLERAAAEVASLSAELARAKGEAASQEQAAGALRSQHLEALRQAADMQAKVLELEMQQGDHRAQASEEAQGLEQRLEAAEKEAAEAGQKARKAAEERDLARQELRQERQAGLGSSAKAQEELHALRQRELKASARSTALEEEVKQLRGRCAALAQEALAARSSVVVSEPVAGGPVLLHDPSVGNCLIQTVSSLPPSRSYRLSQAATRQGRASVAGTTVKHIGTTTRVIGGSPTSPVLTGQAVPTSPVGTTQSMPPTSPTSGSFGFGASPLSPVATAVSSHGPPVVRAGPVTTVVPTSPQVTRAVVAKPRPARVTVTHTVGHPKQVQGNVSVQILGVRRIKQ